MAAYRRFYDSRHLQADCWESGSAQETYARQSSMGYRYLFTGVKAEAVTASLQVMEEVCGLPCKPALPAQD